ncbi:hypothetical protein BH09MYX1_BH09MYX1_03320 [soil metagenome]
MTLRHFAPPRVAEAELPGSYRWYYFDAVADDERSAFCAIFLFGSIFSPYYAARLARGEAASPLDHAAVSFVHYRRGERPLFCFSEYGPKTRHRVQRPLGAQIARSSFERQHDGSIRIDVEDTQIALRTPVRASFSFSPREPSMTPRPVQLSGREHEWHGIMPRARVHGVIEGVADFEGTGYHDTNFGSEPPARLLSSWSWGRVHERGRTRIFFDLNTTDGRRSHELVTTGGGRATAILPPRRERAAMTSWMLSLPKLFEAEPGHPLERITPLERAPFYSRFLARFPGAESDRVGLAEHIDFARLDHPFVRRMIALRLARPELDEWGTLP